MCNIFIASITRLIICILLINKMQLCLVCLCLGYIIPWVGICFLCLLSILLQFYWFVLSLLLYIINSVWLFWQWARRFFQRFRLSYKGSFSPGWKGCYIFCLCYIVICWSYFYAMIVIWADEHLVFNLLKWNSLWW